MHTINKAHSVPAIFFLFLIATSSVSLTSCGDDASDRSGYDATARGDSIRNADGTYTFTDGTVRNADGTYTYRDGTRRNAGGIVLNTDGTYTDPDGTVRNADGTVRRDDGTVSRDGDRVRTPAEERNETLTDLRRMHAQLMAELEKVRTRLNDGTLTPQEQAAQSSRAGELAQGLERLDRAILEVDQSNDTTWPAIRSNSRRGADDFRAWMRQNDMQG